MLARASHDPSQGCQNQKRHVPLEAGEVGVRVEVGLTEGPTFVRPTLVGLGGGQSHP
jgi:hypothetical protein